MHDGDKTCSLSAFRRNTAERVYVIESAHNPEVAGSNPAPATPKGLENGAFRLLSTTRGDHTFGITVEEDWRSVPLLRRADGTCVARALCSSAPLTRGRRRRGK